MIGLFHDALSEALRDVFPGAYIREVTILEEAPPHCYWQMGSVQPREVRSRTLRIRIDLETTSHPQVPQRPSSAVAAARIPTLVLPPPIVPHRADTLYPGGAARIHELYVGGKSAGELARWFPSLSVSEIEECIRLGAR